MISQENKVTKLPEGSFGDDSTAKQMPTKVIRAKNDTENQLIGTATNSEKLNPQPLEGIALPSGDCKPLISHGLQNQANSDQDNATTSAKPISDRKRAANRENARHSTGPKTAAGKAASSRNSYKHGILSRNMASEESDRTMFEKVLDDIAGYYEPVGFMEEFLVEKLTTETMRFSRLLEYEQKELQLSHPFSGQGVDRILRYQATINRQLFQAIEELERLQKLRKEQQNSSKAPVVEDETGNC